ncbi:hypothetical protein [Lusitaniella coriacea]|uniref:hypothetical protein n=1 Tax=Lusitaniella coriacea TaxID=1983105 RepID=UPI003CEE18BA
MTWFKLPDMRGYIERKRSVRYSLAILLHANRIRLGWKIAIYVEQSRDRAP